MPNYLEAPKRNALLGLLSDAAGRVNAFAQTPDPTMPMGKANPLLSLLSEFAGVPAVQRTLDRLSYGEPITNAGKANVPLIPADTADAAMALAPIAGAAMKYGPGVVRTAANNAMIPSDMAMQGQRGMAYIPKNELVDKIASLAKEHKGLKLGLRVLPEEQEAIAVGDVVPPSFVWKNGEPTSKSLVGTSTAGIGRGTPEEIAAAIKNLGLYPEELRPFVDGYYIGNKVGLVGGDGVSKGADRGERVIKNGRLLWVDDNPRYSKDKP